jgi:hypothetical protein
LLDFEIIGTAPVVLQKYVPRDENSERPVGYAALIERYGLLVPGPRHVSTVSTGARQQIATPTGVHENFPEQFLRDESDVGQLIFALKYDGVDLLVLRRVFDAMGSGPLVDALRKKPTSRYLRRLWFFYELLTRQRLEVDDTTVGAYVDVLDPEHYVTRPGPKLRRYRVNLNLLGNADWCPIVRWTPRLRVFEDARLHQLARAAVSDLSPRDLQRAIRYLYAKETRASFELERETPSTRMERFVEALFAHGAERGGHLWWDERELVEIAGVIINDPRFVPTGYRTAEVRVSEQRSLAARERVHFIGARHKDVRDLMRGFVSAWKQHHFEEESHGIRESCGVPFLDFVMAGCLSFGFVYIHPFQDGNGRLHRLMVHRVLCVSGFTPPGVVIPTSAAILHDLPGYDVALEDFSKRIMPLVEHSIRPSDGELTVHNETVDLYRYPDLTVQVEALFEWFASAIRTELVEELHTMRAIDEAKQLMRLVVELPDQRENLLLQLCMQNFSEGRGYTLSKAKRTALFSELTDDEVTRLEAAIHQAFTATE